METEIVDDEEFAAIELALQAASAMRGKVCPQLQQPNANNNHQQPMLSVSNPIQQGQNQQPNRSGTIDAFFASSLRPPNATTVSQQHNQQQRQQSQNKSPSTQAESKPMNFPKTLVTFQLVKNRRVSASTNTFNQRVIDVLKSLKDKAYDPATRDWSFGVDSHDDVIKQLKSIQNVETRPLPSFVLRAIAKQPAATSNVPIENSAQSTLERLPTLIKVNFLTSIGFPITNRITNRINAIK
jgi:hypothetical protein